MNHFQKANQLAENMKKLKTKDAKKRQAHLICRTLIAGIRSK
jgi:hypothetical protein